jgi:hypothetical protein
VNNSPFLSEPHVFCNSFQFALFYTFRDLATSLNMAVDQKSVAILGSLAASVAAIITQPIDVIKTRMMTSSSSKLDEAPNDKGKPLTPKLKQQTSSRKPSPKPAVQAKGYQKIQPLPLEEARSNKEE